VERREQLVEAALAVVAEAGLKGLTHRAVDTRAGLPSGSTANVFRDRNSLVRGVLDGLEVRNRDLWAAMAGQPPSTAAELADQAAAGFIAIAGESHADLSRVRMTMALACPDEVRAGHQRLLDQLKRLMAGCKITNIDVRAPLVAALLDGNLFHVLTVAGDQPIGHDDLAAAVHSLLVN
jgi:DNA-binding transcriptional regulator YbjK